MQITILGSYYIYIAFIWRKFFSFVIEAIYTTYIDIYIYV